MSHWPPRYLLRRSTRAKRVQLQFSPMKGLELIVPEKNKFLNINRFLDEHRAWIEARFKDSEQFQYQCASSSLVFPPKALVLPAIRKTITVHYSNQLNKKQLYSYLEADKKLIIANSHRKNQIASINTWLKEQARHSLGPWLETLSKQLKLRFKAYSIRGQKHCWGSCSSEKRISLNYKLLFLPKKVVNYVLLHELCHLKHCNHSKRFWALVAQWEPEYEQLDALSRQGDCYVPPWVSE